MKKIEKLIRKKDRISEEDSDVLRRQKRWLNDKDYTITRMQDHRERLEWMEDRGKR